MLNVVFSDLSKKKTRIRPVMPVAGNASLHIMQKPQSNAI